MSNVVDMTNFTVGKLTVLERDYTKNKNRTGARWICKCECGKVLSISGWDLRSPTGYKSCGCSKMEHCTTHNMAHTPEYEVWKGITKRCYNKNCKQFKDWGGRGIKMCERWENSFLNFYTDMGPRPNSEMFIERINNDGDYEPSNCKWASRTEQNRNRSYNKIKYKREADIIRTLYSSGQYTQKEISKIYDCDEPVIWHIVNNRTWK